MSEHWDQHEELLVALAADDLDHNDGGIAPTLMALDHDDTGVLVRARRPRHRDHSDPVSELATFVAARQPARVVLAVAGQMHDGAGEELGPGLACSSAQWSQGRWRHRLRLLTEPFGDADRPGGRLDVDVAGSPLSMLLDDALRHPVNLEVWTTLAVLAALGHTVHVSSETVVPNDVPHPERLTDRQCRQVLRLASEFGRRHTPLSASGAPRSLPAVLTDIPPGWQAACPL